MELKKLDRMVLNQNGEIQYLVTGNTNAKAEEALQRFHPDRHYILRAKEAALGLYGFSELDTPHILLQAELQQILDFFYVRTRVNIDKPELEYQRELQSWHNKDHFPVTLHDPQGNEVAKSFCCNIPRQEEEKHLLKTLKGIYKTYDPPEDFPEYLILARSMGDCELKAGSFVLLADTMRTWSMGFRIREDLGPHSHGRLMLAQPTPKPKHPTGNVPPRWRNGHQCHGYVIALLPTEKTWPAEEDEL